jgi:hypothetical protein
MVYTFESQFVSVTKRSGHQGRDYKRGFVYGVKPMLSGSLSWAGSQVFFFEKIVSSSSLKPDPVLPT